MFRIEKNQTCFAVHYDGSVVTVSSLCEPPASYDATAIVGRKLQYLANYTVRHSRSKNKPQTLKRYFEETGWNVILPSDYESETDKKLLSPR